MRGVFNHAHLAIFDLHGGGIKTKIDYILFHLMYVFRSEDELGKSYNLLWINAFKAQGVDFEFYRRTVKGSYALWIQTDWTKHERYGMPSEVDKALLHLAQTPQAILTLMTRYCDSLGALAV
jgi:hypothetical protein